MLSVEVKAMIMPFGNPFSHLPGLCYEGMTHHCDWDIVQNTPAVSLYGAALRETWE